MEFRKCFTARELDRGTDMLFHPVTGELLCELKYCEVRRAYFTTVPQGGWDWDGEDSFRPRIGDGQSRQPGEAYPEHWLYDPMDGVPLCVQN